MLADEAGKLLHTSNAYHHQWSAKLAELLVTLTQQQGGLGSATGSAASSASAKVFFSNSGTEANEGALKVARKVGKMRWAEKNGRSWDDPACDKFEIVCFENAFHGRSMGALSVTTNPKYQQPFAPLIPGVKVGKFNVKEDVESLVTDKTCAVIVEPVQGEGGIHFADEEFLRALRARCNETGAVLIYDEIQVCILGYPRSAYNAMLTSISICLPVWHLPDRQAMGSLQSAGRLPPRHCYNGQTACQRVPNRRGAVARLRSRGDDAW